MAEKDPKDHLRRGFPSLGAPTPQPPAPAGEVQGDAPQVDPLAAERERQLKLADMMLANMRTPRRSKTRMRLIGWAIALAILAFFFFLLPRMLNRSPSVPYDDSEYPIEAPGEAPFEAPGSP